MLTAGSHRVKATGLERTHMRFFRSLLKDCSGATAVEYGVLAAILAVSLTIALGNYYEVMNAVFVSISNTYQNAAAR